MYSMHAQIFSWGKQEQLSGAWRLTTPAAGKEVEEEVKKKIKGLADFFLLTGRLKGCWFVSQYPLGNDSPVKTIAD